jgi:hypothetical protein
MFKQHLVKPFHSGSIVKLERLKKEYSKIERSRDIAQAVTKILSEPMIDFTHKGSNNFNRSVVITATNVP